MLRDAVSIATITAHTVQGIVIASLNEKLHRIKILHTVFNYSGHRDTTITVVEQYPELDTAAMISMFFFLSALFQTVGYVAYVRNQRFDDAVALRYVEFSVSASIMYALMAAIIGMQQVETVVLYAVAMFATNVLGLAAHVVENRATAWLFHACGWVTYSVPFLFLILSVDRTRALSDGRLDDRLIAVVAVVGSLFSLFGFVQVYDLLYRPQGKQKVDTVEPETTLNTHFQTVGMAYDLLSLIDKSILAWLIFATMAESKV